MMEWDKSSQREVERESSTDLSAQRKTSVCLASFFFFEWSSPPRNSKEEKRTDSGH
jgi:hypothetical protein